ncbi:hypothetical protein BJY01DRAFT_221980 [Aspergillus pseudoustus]|uniref:Integral membrane protein n=1 Tax=Aspergillus pseudoustus TaxID=1810923 RepID=A0ABR4J9E3_9EURO
MTDVSRYLRFGRFSVSATGVIVLTYFVLYLLSLRYYHGLSYRDPTSFFFDADHAYERRYSSKRVDEATTFIANAGDVKPPIRDLGEQPTLCVGIVSVRRRGDQYVGLTVGSLLDGLSEPERKKMLLYLRIGNTNPADHPVYSEKWVETLPDRVLTYSKDDPDFDQLQQWEEGGWYRNKTIYDFTTLMSECYESGADYVAMLEDDTLAVKGWFPAAMRALSTVQQRTAGRDWVYLRLFYIDGLLGWNSEDWPKYLTCSFIVWAALTAAMTASKRKFKAELRYIPNSAIWLASCIFIPAAIALHFMAGRQTMWPLSPGVHEMNKYGCCSQGLVFPRSIIPRFLEHTDLTTDWLVDMMVEKIANSQDWPRFAVVPPLLQHIGSTSSKGYGFDNSASTIWNFRFEDYTI